MPLPTGEQFEISHGGLHVAVTEIGATLRSFRVGEMEILDTFGPEELGGFSRGQVLLPFPNRIDGGIYQFDGRKHQLPLTEPERNNAIHGLTRWLNWTPLQKTGSSITLGHRLHPQEGYPFTLDLGLEYTLSSKGLAITTTASNAGAEPLPFGAGYHPYFTVGTPFVDTTRLRIPAASYLETDERLIPTGRSSVEGTDLDFREEREIGGVELDTCYADVIPSDDGYTYVTLTNPGSGFTITVWMDGKHGFIQAYSGDTVLETDRRRSIAIEPMTCAPNAFNTGVGLRVIEPGESFTTAWGISAG